MLPGEGGKRTRIFSERRSSKAGQTSSPSLYSAKRREHPQGIERSDKHFNRECNRTSTGHLKSPKSEVALSVQAGARFVLVGGGNTRNWPLGGGRTAEGLLKLTNRWQPSDFQW